MTLYENEKIARRFIKIHKRPFTANDLMAKCEISRRATYRLINKLEAIGYIKQISEGKHNRIFVHIIKPEAEYVRNRKLKSNRFGYGYKKMSIIMEVIEKHSIKTTTQLAIHLSFSKRTAYRYIKAMINAEVLEVHHSHFRVYERNNIEIVGEIEAKKSQADGKKKAGDKTMARNPKLSPTQSETLIQLKSSTHKLFVETQ